MADDHYQNLVIGSGEAGKILAWNLATTIECWDSPRLAPKRAILMAVVQTAMLGGIPYTVLRDAIFTHPTAAEGLVALFAAVPASTT